MDQEPDVIRQQIDETRSSLTEKLETLEGQVRGTVQEARSTVEETIQNVKDSVHETVATVKRTFDLNYQVRQHPWAMFGGSVVAGYVAGTFLAPRPGHRPAWSGPTHDGHAMRPAGPRDTWSGQTARQDLSGQGSSGSGWASWFMNQFHDEIEQAKGLAVGAAVGLVRDIIKQSVPQLGPQIEQLMNNVTSKLGGQPIHQPLMESASGSSASARTEGFSSPAGQSARDM
jgi:ElaB/YqjD/DUF883 family membrane-anchored ribosome-binding protein